VEDLRDSSLGGLRESIKDLKESKFRRKGKEAVPTLLFTTFGYLGRSL
jgi:hypothetical protein